MKKTIAILEGDGIGPEIVREALKVLKVVAEKYGHEFDLITTPFGAAAYYSEGTAFPEKTKQVCDGADVIIKGPVGLAVDQMDDIPQDLRPEVAAILPLRKRYDTFANYRPVRLPKNLAAFSPLKKEIIGEGLDILMIRELVGGIYFGEKTEGPAAQMAFAKDDCVYTEAQIRRVAHVAFAEAKKNASLLTNIHKANVYSMIGSIAFLYDKCLDLKPESEIIWQALFEVFERGYTTIELAHSSIEPKKTLSTSDFGDMVVEIIDQS